MVKSVDHFGAGRKPAKKRQGLRKRVPVRMLIPNLVTLLGLAAGLTAIRMAIEGRFEIAIYAIFFAAIMDMLDGRIARVLRASSRFGAELDSLADFVNFGVAPAIIIFNWALNGLHSIGWIAVLVFALCTALRLARFNVALDEAEKQPLWKKNYFSGIPAPAGAITVLLPVYLYFMGFEGILIFRPLILIYTLAIALLMVSTIPTFSGKLLGARIDRDYVLPVFIGTIVISALLFTYNWTMLVICALAYLGTIPYSWLTYRRQQDRWQKRSQGKARNKENAGRRKKSGLEIKDRIITPPPSDSIH